MAALPPGTRLKNGAYILENVLGRGGFGITYRAQDVWSGDTVAIKECFPLGCERKGQEVAPGDFFSASHLESFKTGMRQQAESLEKLQHPAIVRVLENFEANNTVYMVMQFVPGPTLHQLVESEGPVAPEAALGWLEPLASAVRALHGAGLLHLDIKPENAIVAPIEDHPHLVLVDFDLIQPREANDFRTRPLALAAQCGTPGYSPLEQYSQHARLTPASDVYALGATMYHLLTGQAPCPAVDRAAGAALKLPSDYKAGVPEHMERAVLEAMEMKPEARFADVPAFLQALRTGDGVRGDDDDPAFSQPSSAQFVAHTSGLIHRIVVTTDKPILPQRCVCCFDRSQTDYFVSGPSHRWTLPLCLACKKHHGAAKQGGIVTLWGIVISLVIALGGVAVSVATDSFWPILLGPAGIFINFVSMNYGGLKNSRAEELMNDTCCDLSEPVTHNFNGRVHIWRFKNARYAEEFKKRNAPFVV